MSDLVLPSARAHNSLKVSVVFYTWPQRENRITVGFPDNFPAPHGALKHVCRTAREVEKWDAALRQQERDDKEKTAEERSLVEEPLLRYMASELANLVATARNNKNREFMEASAKILAAKREAREKAEKANQTESFMHSEGYEQGK